MMRMSGRCFGRARASLFDPIGAAESAANFSLGLLLNHERVTRMIDLASRYEGIPGFNEMANQLVETTLGANQQTGYSGELQRLVSRLVLDHLIQLAANTDASGQARALATLKINNIKQRIAKRIMSKTDEHWKAHDIFALTQIQRFENNPEAVPVTDPLPAPDGSPIGQDAGEEMGTGGKDWCGTVVT